MIEISLGKIIKKRRQELNLTQKELCEGICESMTLSRIERGEQSPSRNRMIALFQRLGLPDDRYYALINSNEEKIEILQEKIKSYGILVERAVEPEKSRLIAEARETIKELESFAAKDDTILQQFILRQKVILGEGDGTYSLDDQLRLTLEALRLTVPRFDLEEINNSLYTLEEVSIINHISCIYSLKGNHRKAADILGQVLKYIQKHYQDIRQSAGHLPLITHNYARALTLCKRYEEAVEIAELGWRSCIEYGHYQFLPGIIHIMAECWHFLDNDDKSKDLFYQAYYLYKTINNKKNLRLLIEDAKRCCNIEFPSTVE